MPLTNRLIARLNAVKEKISELEDE